MKQITITLKIKYFYLPLMLQIRGNCYEKYVTNNSEEKCLASDKSPESQNWANLPASYQGNKNSVPADNIYTFHKH